MQSPTHCDLRGLSRNAMWLVSIGLSCFLAASALAAPTTLPGIIDEYSFDDGSGLTAVDTVGSNNATLQGFPVGNSQWITGIFGGALNFTNASSYAITGSPISSTASGSFSVSFWSRSDANPNSNSSVLLTPQGTNLIGYDQGHGIGIGSVYDTAQPLKDVWENYVVTVDRTAGTAAVYRDGALVASGAESIPALNTPWVFAHNQDPGNTNGSYNGALDDVQFYNRVLSPSDAATLASRPPQPGLAAHLVVPAQSYGSQPTGQYATASTSLFIDPSKTDWLAWNRFPDLRAVSDASPGQQFLGTYTPEVDDSFNLKVTNPLGQSLTFALDQNGALGAPIGQQSVIYGASGAAPEVVRGDNVGTPYFSNEVGQFNSLFTVAGTYTFSLSFQNIGGDAGYPNVYLLTHTVPEPEGIALSGVGSGMLLYAMCYCRRRRGAWVR